MLRMWLLDALGRWTALQQHLAIAGLLHRSGGMGMGPQVCVCVCSWQSKAPCVQPFTQHPYSRPVTALARLFFPLSLFPLSSPVFSLQTQSFVVCFSFSFS